eukprot:CAMPEP_0177631776 /NCGR_PEP_ID=MMETSP0447-20121125/1927_1 /TAXON_ID=0 /ORGANISM="Stygamoeba regulata, Strain BSH-02190019" /LENGTH=407 /DNA_ID=CAMNT_0019133277 /DNA_START=192 /DNA_END=1415 /DNA_ORIENTATION=+
MHRLCVTRAGASVLPCQIALRPLNTSVKYEFSFYDASVEYYALKPMRSMAMGYVLDYWKTVSPDRILASARYLHTELPVRLARPIRAMQTLPFIVLTNPNIRDVFDHYWETFQELRSFPPIETLEQEAEYSRLLERGINIHKDVVTTLSMGVREIRRLPASINLDFDALSNFIDKFLAERVSRRVLAEQHLAAHNPRHGWRGIVNMACSAYEHVRSCAEKVAGICEQAYGVAPLVQIEGDLDTTFPYISMHLNYALFELLKNAFRAVVENHAFSSETRCGPLPLCGHDLPPIVVTICKGEDVTIIIGDKGGGISKESMAQIWTYGFTTYDFNEHIKDGSNAAVGVVNLSAQAQATQQMAGYGYGLPMARVYAKYMGGDVKVVSMPGYGTNVYLTIKPVREQCERILI